MTTSQLVPSAVEPVEPRAESAEPREKVRGGWLGRLLSGRRTAYRKVRPHQVRRLIEEGAVVVDVREPAQWRAGHIRGSVNIPLADVLDRSEDLPDGPIVTVCRSGPRSARAAELLAADGHQTFNLRGGLREWDYAGYPVMDAEGEPGFVA
ncbi:rhodanese-related sulfurtransferase [Georgenia soli]|uniref:Rhodanese-related sulfurtransferase n=1 Tax=Georgenia soli TaxID=638953 RepID=A0A2A9ELT9_9MICO|nr:rhodanese-like domain-containing protein [Georgenia soli]PFG39878.1 rhodanese-related sulfurtransferase [Georgenia soli]